MSFDTLEEAIALGQGEERPFRCPEHDDSVASASINMLKMVWYCFGCHASGRIDGKKRAPTNIELGSMIRPDVEMRTYPGSYLELFDVHEDAYWNARHPEYVSYALGMGQDPFTGDATFAVHSPRGALAGVGRRRVTDDKGTRYLYPYRWSSSRTLGGTMGRYPSLPVLCLVEGMADAASVWATGCPGIAVYGAGLHAPQVELIARLNPQVVLIGYDMDDAGERAVSSTFKLLGRRYQLARVKWKEKDPSATSYRMRKELLRKAVGGTRYGDVTDAWSDNVAAMKQRYDTHIKEDHAPA